jgi:hypothetical protein
MKRALDVGRVPVDQLAPLVQHAILRAPLLERPKRVPHVGVLGDEAQRDLAMPPAKNAGTRTG